MGKALTGVGFYTIYPPLTTAAVFRPITQPTVQLAVLFTIFDKERQLLVRRMRVQTVNLQLAKSPDELFESVDPAVAATSLIHKVRRQSNWREKI